VPRRLHLAVLSLVVSAALFSPTAAHAERWVGTDAAGDVGGWQLSPEPEPCGTFTEYDAPENTNDDITRVVVRHTRSAVQLKVRLRDLDPALEQQVTIHLATASRGWFLDIDRWEGRGGKFQVMAFLAKEPNYPDLEDIEDECGTFGFVSGEVRCRVRPEVDLKANLVRATVPRSCLKNPRWVRVGVDAYGFVEPADPEDETFGGLSDEWGVRDETTAPFMPPFGPKVRTPPRAKLGASPVEAGSTGPSSPRSYLVRPRLP
jgi:hypothetical protein